MKNRVVAALGGVLVTALVVQGLALSWVCGKVRLFEKDHGADVFANLDKHQLELQARPAREQVAVSPSVVVSQPAVTNRQLVVRSAGIESDGLVKIVLSEMPDMDVMRHYLEITPPLAQPPDISFERDDDESTQVSLFVKGDYAFRTNHLLRLRRSLPGKDAAVRPLAEDFVLRFVRGDLPATVGYAAPGRYLPPCGSRSLALESVNVGAVHAEISRVEPQNIVQLLAREEDVYSCNYNRCIDGRATTELSGEASSFTLPCRNEPNKKEITSVRIGLDDGKPANGVFLVKVRNADCPESDYRWLENRPDYNPPHFRLVCLSDLGLSVRRDGDDSLGVWVTSLTTGRPVAAAKVEVFSSANIKVMEGVTGADGWCRTRRTERGTPFAVVVSSEDGSDRTFMALRESMKVDEMQPDGARQQYLEKDAVAAFLWTDRGIYRHGEKVFVQAIVRDGTRRSPGPIPVEIRLVSPRKRVFASVTRVTDGEGAVAVEEFSVPAEQPSGVWKLQATVPGKEGVVLGEKAIRIEEFAPPQVRVEVSTDDRVSPTGFTFTVRSEHLFGGPAHGLACEGAVVFEDVPFAPERWKGWRFGNDDLGLKPNFTRLDRAGLDRDGRHAYDMAMDEDFGRPKAAVGITVQGVVFEDGGRPATARKKVVAHAYPYYIGSTLPDWLRREPGTELSVPIACVSPEGDRLSSSRRLTARLERVERVYSYRDTGRGWQTWDCDCVRRPVVSGLDVVTATNANTTVRLPVAAPGDYVLTVSDAETGVSYAHAFYLSDWGDGVTCAPQSDPTAVSVTPDKAVYRCGDRPRLLVKAPFAGAALVTVMRDRLVHAEVLTLTNAVSEVTLPPMKADFAPNLEVSVSVIQGVTDNARNLAVRAHGETTLVVRPKEEEIPVRLDAKVVDLREIDVSVDAPGAASVRVTVVDEGINQLTGEETPDPIAWFSTPRTGDHPLFDLYHRILPVVGEQGPGKGGVKTGGGACEDMLGRVSPQPTRRFTPLARWSARLPVEDGRCRTTVRIPDFVGEVRVTVVACSERASGAAAVLRKVTPKLVVLPDAPRFVAPDDLFGVSLPIYNRCGGEARLGCEIFANGESVRRLGLAVVPKDGMTNVTVLVRAPSKPGEMTLRYRVRGMGEIHERTILVPVRPAVAWIQTAGVMREEAWHDPTNGIWSARHFDSPVGDLAHALQWLADYPHGCLEQTSSRILPLVGAGAFLGTVVSNGADYVLSGVRRVESMVRANDFVMWPDCTYAPWDVEVSQYAAHFLFEAEKGGCALTPEIRDRVLSFQLRQSSGTNLAVAAYACHNLALAGRADRAAMFSLYDRREELSLLSRSRLARAFALVYDRKRAAELLKSALAPSSVKEAAFAMMALLAVDPGDERLPILLADLNARRDRVKFCWGTTGENAHALWAIGAFYAAHPPKPGERFVAWRKLTLPDLVDVQDEESGLSISRRFLSPEGTPVDTSNLRCGEMLVAELTLKSADTRELNDLVVEDLFAGGVEPIHGNLSSAFAFPQATNVVATADWVMRSDARDDRMLVFSKKFLLEKGHEAKFRYPVRVVTAGEYVLPGPSVEGMYHPLLHARRAPGRLVVRR